MTGMTFAWVLHASLVASGADTYAAAVREAEKGKPIVILVSTEWCGPCRKMEKTVLPEVRKRGLLRRVAFAIVNPDRQRKLARLLTRGNPAVPQLVMYRQTDKGWRRSGLVGGQSVDSVEKFIKQAIVADEVSEGKGAETKAWGGGRADEERRFRRSEGRACRQPLADRRSERVANDAAAGIRAWHGRQGRGTSHAIHRGQFIAGDSSGAVDDGCLRRGR